MLYFAYGSNMSVPRLRQRVPSAQPMGMASLDQHRLDFHKSGRDGSAKCDAFLTCRPDDRVYGVLFHIDPEELKLLHQFEGLGLGYDLKEVLVQREDGRLQSAFTYFAIHIDRSLKPYHWYLRHVLHGARCAGLPADYIGKLEQLDSWIDPDPVRTAQELSVYSNSSNNG
ncbi:gamma-glutamylcyclotransferase family protein [Marinobacterium arenosum]|uniref:gamma-glutamylcyclotransferase family protein n=1 Tax=Marinobacterium arenosum TaxID=2862496 RepID=UPI001C98BA5C|nr:gamma-glutamylcyclotransferase family protein [Marinobacterium arenosum]MBY4675098.1 gamma-glutamylcyclotransferase [Marinobacterium arenosum]